MHLLVVDFHGTITPDTPMPYVVRCGTCGVHVAEGTGAVRVGDLEHHCPDTTSAIREWSITYTPAEVELLLPLESVDLDA